MCMKGANIYSDIIQWKLYTKNPECYYLFCIKTNRKTNENLQRGKAGIFIYHIQQHFERQFLQTRKTKTHINTHNTREKGCDYFLLVKLCI